jgi:CDP-glucose 4,6-dehydratase
MKWDFWRGKNVLVTGHTGFKGSWLSLWLIKLGANVTGYALKPPSSYNLFEEAKIAELIHSVEGDIRDYDLLSSVIKQTSPEIIIHLAAQPLVRHSYSNTIETYSTNVMGVVNLLEVVRKIQSVKSIINVTTDKCYQNNEWIWGYRETDHMGGHDPYSSSKACSELVTSAFRDSFYGASDGIRKVGLATARAGNVIGGGDWALDRLVPDVLSAFEHGHYPKVRNPTSIRPWQHVLEPIRGYLMLAQKNYEFPDEYAEAWNFGPEDSDSKTVEYVVQALADFWGSPLAQYSLEDIRDKPKTVLHEAKNLSLDISKARARLNWSPLINLDEAIRLTMEWHKARSNGKIVRDITLDQIEQYQKLATY